LLITKEQEVRSLRDELEELKSDTAELKKNSINNSSEKAENKNLEKQISNLREKIKNLQTKIEKKKEEVEQAKNYQSLVNEQERELEELKKQLILKEQELDASINECIKYLQTIIHYLNKKTELEILKKKLYGKPYNAELSSFKKLSESEKEFGKLEEKLLTVINQQNNLPKHTLHNSPNHNLIANVAEVAVRIREFSEKLVVIIESSLDNVNDATKEKSKMVINNFQGMIIHGNSNQLIETSVSGNCLEFQSQFQIPPKN
jgi:DNA repair exonuclease SbcCD ATPase subunit